jgi:hypothetical protein
VTPRHARALVAGQSARVTFAGDNTRYRATVEQVRYETSIVPKVGLGQGRDELVTVTLRLDDPTVILVPGTPVSVVITK